MEPTFSSRWLYRHHTQQKVALGRQICAVCGLPTATGVATAKVLRPTFTDIAALRCPRSSVVCAACEWYMGNQEIRRSSWWLTEEVATEVDKGEWHTLLLEHLAHPPARDSYYLITVTKRKHLALYAPLNMAGNPMRRVRFEVSTLDLHPALWPALPAAAHQLRTRHSWKEIQADSYNSYFAAQWPAIAHFAALRNTVRPYLHTPYLDLAQFVWTPPAGTKEIETDMNEDNDDE